MYKIVRVTHKNKSLEERKGRTLEELLHEVARSREPLTLVLEKGKSVTIEPASQLKPLPRLEGCMPEGWRDFVY